MDFTKIGVIHLNQIGDLLFSLPLLNVKMDTFIFCPAVVIGLDELARNEKLSTTADMLGQRIRSENGVEKAITLIEQTFA